MKNFVGTGPFRFVERMPDRYVQLRRFEEYTPREEEADNYGGRRVAYLDEVRFVPVPDASTRLQGAIAGQFDYVDALPVENAPQLKGEQGGGDHLQVLRMAVLLHQCEAGAARRTSRCVARSSRR